MKYFVQFAVIALICVAGEMTSAVLPFSFPSSVSGMIVLFVLLLARVIKPHNIKETADFLTKNMALFFAPLAVNMVRDWGILKEVMVQVLIICIIATLVTFFVTAYTVKGTVKLLHIIRGDNK